MIEQEFNIEISNFDLLELSRQRLKVTNESNSSINVNFVTVMEVLFLLIFLLIN